MDQVFSWASIALFFLAGPLAILNRRRLARYIIRQNKFLFDNVPTLFPPPPADAERRRELVFQYLILAVGLGFVAISLLVLWRGIHGGV